MKISLNYSLIKHDMLVFIYECANNGAFKFTKISVKRVLFMFDNIQCNCVSVKLFHMKICLCKGHGFRLYKHVFFKLLCV